MRLAYEHRSDKRKLDPQLPDEVVPVFRVIVGQQQIFFKQILDIERRRLFCSAAVMRGNQNHGIAVHGIAVQV